MTILITGARGKVGRAVADRPHAAVLPVRAAGTNPAELTVPAGVEIADVLGREIRVERISHAEAERQMSQFMPTPTAGSLLALWAAPTAGPAAVADTTEPLLGRPARSFRQWASENSAASTR